MISNIIFPFRKWSLLKTGDAGYSLKVPPKLRCWKPLPPTQHVGRRDPVGALASGLMPLPKGPAKWAHSSTCAVCACKATRPSTDAGTLTLHSPTPRTLRNTFPSYKSPASDPALQWWEWANALPPFCRGAGEASQNYFHFLAPSLLKQGYYPF